jgi:hypothetical protein
MVSGQRKGNPSRRESDGRRLNSLTKKYGRANCPPLAMAKTETGNFEPYFFISVAYGFG